MTAICQEWDLRIEDWSIGGFGEEVWGLEDWCRFPFGFALEQ